MASYGVRMSQLARYFVSTSLRVQLSGDFRQIQCIRPSRTEVMQDRAAKKEGLFNAILQV
jgi:hypothetical protein